MKDETSQEVMCQMGAYSAQVQAFKEEELRKRYSKG